MKKEKRVFPESSFLLCHLVDQTMLIGNLCLNGKERADSEVLFIPHFACCKSSDWRLVGALNFICDRHTNNASLLEGMVTLQNHKCE